jgi:hypothetical protein
MNIQDEILDIAAKEMQEDIDREILWGMLEGIGWHRVMLPTLGDAYMAVDIITWLEENCKEAYERHSRDFIFESAKDANWFKLRWLG